MESLAQQQGATRENLRRQQTLLQAACDLVGLSPYTWDPQTNLLNWDAQLKAMWGLPPEAAVDYETWRSAIHPEDLPAVQASLDRALRPGGLGIYNAEYRVIGICDGLERWVATYGRTFFDGDKPVEFIGAAVDITERKQAEQALRNSEKRFRLFADISANVLWMIDASTGSIVFRSAAFQRVWGLGDDDWTSSRDWLASVHQEDRAATRAVLDSVRETGQTARWSYRIVRADGAVRWIQDIAFPIRGEDGRLEMIGGLAQDVTRQTGSIVYLVGGEEPTQKQHVHLLRDAAFQVKTFPNPRAFLDLANVLSPGCLVLDLRSTGDAGLAVCQELQARSLPLAVIVLDESHGDVARAVRIMKAGALDVLQAPCTVQTLITAVACGVAEVRARTQVDDTADDAKRRVGELRQREREVLDHLIAGGTNKTIARALGISPRTVETHRAHVMERLGAQTLPEMVLTAAAAGLSPPGKQRI